MIRLAFRRSRRAGVLWGYVFAAFVASSALTYRRVYPTTADRQRLATTFGANHAAAALFGPAAELQTVAGFTAYKVFMSLALMGGIWGLLIATRLLRGEEDAGRWEMLLSGPFRAGRATAATMAGLGISLVVVWAFTAMVTIAVGRSSTVRISPGAACFLGLVLVLPAVLFAVVGALASQMAPTRRRAAGYAAVALGLAYALRLLADSGIGLHWLAWTSPLGWVELTRPLVGSDAAPLVPIFAFVAVAAGATVVLASVRDAGAAVWPERTRARTRAASVDSLDRLGYRLMRSQWAAWSVGIAAGGVLMGLVAKAAGSTISGSSVQEIFARLGARGSGAYTYLGIAFLFLTVLVAFEGVGQVSALTAEESEGRLTHLLAAPVSRSRWYVSRVVPAVVLIGVGGLLSGLGTWLGAATEHAGVSMPRLLGAGLNLVPVALLAVGVGAAVFGWWPRWSSPAAYAVLVWSLLVELLAGFLTSGGHWLLDTSIFHQIASAPAVAPDWSTDAVVAALGLVGLIAGWIGFVRRDLV